ncbi:hypothetical protein AaE_014747 [Aphanomyces astaci]|uniref:DDE Tnp4 domain-containing protein n=1 Tax=Aphanomyces astaci TaxID=112090 RepID=A0A6A4Z5A9_APHAT|nr:hypothetical protein AaE_014747 [Aphanomyces astaci]
MPDNGSLRNEYPNSWVLLADKGYQGIHRHMRAITPAKRPAGGLLPVSEITANDRIASDPVVVEICFGRLKTLWTIMSESYSWKRDHYDLFFFKLTLTNVHIRFLPLRDLDGEDFTRYENRLLSLGDIIKSKRAGSMAKYREKRKHRMTIILPPGNSEVDSSSDENKWHF